MINPAKLDSPVRKHESHKVDEIAPHKYVRLTRLLIPFGIGPLSWFPCDIL